MNIEIIENHPDYVARQRLATVGPETWNGEEEDAMERLAHNGVSLAFEDNGKGAPPVLLIHETGCNPGYSPVQIKHLCRKHRVVSIYLPKQNEAIIPQPGRVVTLAHSVAWLCDELGIYKPLAFGDGVGKEIVDELMNRYPELLCFDSSSEGTF